MVWQDRKPIYFVSNYHDLQQVGTALKRNKDGTEAEISMPQLVRRLKPLYRGL